MKVALKKDIKTTRKELFVIKTDDANVLNVLKATRILHLWDIHINVPPGERFLCIL